MTRYFWYPSLVFSNQRLATTQCPVNPSSRVILLVYWTLIFLLFTAWQADITSFLTRTNYRPVVQSLKELAQDNTIKPVIVQGSGVYEFFEVCSRVRVCLSSYTHVVICPLVHTFVSYQGSRLRIASSWF